PLSVPMLNTGNSPGPDRMAIVQHYVFVQPAQPRHFVCDCRMIRRKIKLLASLDLVRIGNFTVAVQRTAVKSLYRNNARSRMTGIERRAGRIAVYINDRARERGMHGRSAELGCEGIKPVNMPVGVVTDERSRHELCRALLGNTHPGV